MEPKCIIHSPARYIVNSWERVGLADPSAGDVSAPFSCSDILRCARCFIDVLLTTILFEIYIFWCYDDAYMADDDHNTQI